jgi:hypothetical protein
MKHLVSVALATALMIPPVELAAQSVTLQPASPQPSSVSPGLAVSYAFHASGRSLREARAALRKSEPGKPLPGLTYEDESEGTPVLTSDASQMVAAQISGYVKFDAPGTYVVDFLTNDGLEISLGGQQVGLYDGVHACGYTGEVEVNVPSAGYYALEATYFQRKGTACLMMELGPDSDGLELVSNSIFFH